MAAMAVMPALPASALDRLQWWVLVGTVAVTPAIFSRWTFDVFNVTELTALWIGAIVAGGLQLTLRSAGNRLSRPGIWPYVVVYVAVLGVATVASRAPMVSFLGLYGRLGGVVTIVPVIAVAWMIHRHLVGRPDRRRQLLAAMGISSVAGGLYLLAQQLDLETVAWLELEGRTPTHPPGLLGNSNFSGAHAALGLAPMAWLAFRQTGWRRAAWQVGVVLALVGVGISQSRGAMAAAVVAFVVIAVRLRLSSRALVTGAVAAGLVLLGAALATNAVGLSDLTSATTADERVDLWEVALAGSPDHLVLGGGPDLYLVTFHEHAGPDLDGVVADEPHNVLLDHLDGGGLVWAGAWLAVVAAVVLAARKSDRRSVSPWSGMGAAYLAQAMVSIDAVPLVLWAWVAAAGVVASANPDPAPMRTSGRVPVVAAVAAAAVVVVGVVVALGPFRADMAYRRAIEAANRGDVDTAVAQFEQAIDRHGWEPRYRRRLGLALWGSAALDGRDTLEAARATLRDALDLFPDDPSATVWLAGVEDQLAAIDS